MSAELGADLPPPDAPHRMKWGYPFVRRSAVQGATMAHAFTVVVPTCNMHAHLPALWRSFGQAGLLERAECVLFVDDGSTDDTPRVLAEIAASARPGEARVEVLTLPKNQGRFFARYAGAKAVRTERVLFLDTRLELPDDFAEQLVRAGEQYPAINGTVDVDVSRNLFCLYWDRSHRALFRHHYAHTHVPVTLTPSNFDAFLKGTTVFYCPTEEWVRACAHFEGSDLLSDDTFLMKRMVETCPITIHPQVRISWVPRETFSQFVWRIWDRGPGFAEYHVYERRGLLFWTVMGGLAALLGWLGLVFVQPWAALWVALVALGAIVLSTAAFAQSPLEFLQLIPLHVATFFAFAFGALRGIVVVAARKLRAPK